MLLGASLASRRALFGLRRAQFQIQRGYAETPKASINDSKTPVLPGSQTASGPIPPVPDLPSNGPSLITSKTISPVNIPLTPPPPSDKPQIFSGTATPPPSTSTTRIFPLSPPPKEPKHRFRNFVLSVFLLSGLSFAGGVWYATRSDNFHDFFTEYVPFGEDAVLYIEEREFRKRHPRLTNTTSRPSSDGGKIMIPSKSGLSWRDRAQEVVGSDLETKGRHMSAVEDDGTASEIAPKKSPAPKAADKSKSIAKDPAPVQKQEFPSNPVQKDEKPAMESNANSIVASQTTKTSTAPVAIQPAGKSVKSPEVNQPSVFIPVSRIDPMKVQNGDEPLVQDLVKMLNDIIIVVNEDNATGKYTSSITKAKSDLERVGQRIKNLKAEEHHLAEKKIQATQTEFDTAAQELVRRLDREIQDQESRWREEFESERNKIEKAYERRLKSETERAKQLNDQGLRNQLLEQAIALKNDFAATVQNKVETERQGRLAKLDALSSSISQLEALTAQWNIVLDGNLQTQHLQVAIEAVKSNLDRADRPKPFIRELAALKELAAEDPVVDSAIASINPVSYQLGLPTSAQLIDRFRRVADEVRKAALLPEDAGIASHATSFVLSKVMFKKQGRVEGDDVESILTRTESLLEEGNLDEAAREMNALQGWAKTLSRDWLSEVRKVLEVKQALDVISTEARLQSLKVG